MLELTSRIRPRVGSWWELRQRILSRWIRKGMPAGADGWGIKSDLFDEASGPHHHMHDLARGCRPIGLDWDIAVTRAAKLLLEREGLDAELVVCDVRALPFAAASLRLVLSLSTLDHFDLVDSIGQSVQEIVRVMRQDGRLILTLDNPRNPEVFLRAHLPRAVVRRLRVDDFPIGRTLDAGPAERLFRLHGLQPFRRDYLIHGPRYAAIRVLDWLYALGARRQVRTVARMLELLEKLSMTPIGVLSGHYIGWWIRKVEEA